jgi:oxygen-independent coproporphyrinogen-3 oxidase
MSNDAAFIEKYYKPVPRYTSYPTVPFWKEGINVQRWKESFSGRFTACNGQEGVSLYIHLPFCESLCIYCGCNKKITTNHKVEEEYILAIFREWNMYKELMDAPPVIRELHLGGGTPTFFSPANLRRLVSGLLDGAVIHADHAFSVEGHPNNTTREHLDALYKLGFRRISYGVQDLNPEVQQAIRRIQPFEQLKRATEDARAAGFTAVNFDLIYGLPLQTMNRLRRTIDLSVSLQPDRLAFYSYAHTPSINCSQKLINDKDLPSPGEKLALYEAGKDRLQKFGYKNIGMDHFALHSDELYKAWKTGTLHRNFMGYTTQHSGLLLGLGVSAISDIGTAYAQNNKKLADYYRVIRSGELAVTKGYFLSEDDQAFRGHILDIACKGHTAFGIAWKDILEEWTLPKLWELEKDGLLRMDSKGVWLTELGRPFLRHVCKAFDIHLLQDEWSRGNGAISCSRTAGAPLFSNAI